MKQVLLSLRSIHLKSNNRFITQSLKESSIIPSLVRGFTSPAEKEMLDEQEELEMKLPKFNQKNNFNRGNADDENQSYQPKFEKQQQHQQQIQQSNLAVERQTHMNIMMGNSRSSQMDQSNKSSQQIHHDFKEDHNVAQFDQKITAKFGEQMLNSISKVVQEKTKNPHNEDSSTITNGLYNSFDAPERLYQVKRIFNENVALKKKFVQKTKFTSFEKISDNLHQLPNFYLNRERVSKFLDIHKNEVTPIKNDWQDKKIIPLLANGLDAVLKTPGIYPVDSINQAEKGRLGNFFTKLPQYSQINEDAIAPYYPPGQDKNLQRLCYNMGCRYLMSTSTISSVLSHIYFCISNFKSPHFNNLTESYDREPLKFMISQRKPNTVFLTKVDKQKRIYSVDGDSGFIEPSNVVLLKMGKYMEKMLTVDHQTFRDHYILDSRTNKPNKEVGKNQSLLDPDYFKYMKSGGLFLRSQIDCQGIDKDGNEVVFELKTRATSVLRYEIGNYLDFLDYEIIKYKGRAQSYEREFYDLVRGGFLKYIMQCKIGQMSGAMVAYHNTQKIFGFEYISLQDMEKRVFGCSEFSDEVFKNSLGLVERIFDFILEDQDGIDSVRSDSTKGSQQNKIFKVGFYANEQERLLNIMVEVFDDDSFYQERFRSVLPEYMTDPIDYYISHKIKPQVYKYTVGIYPVLNGVFIDHSPILFEAGDSLQVKYQIQKAGRVEFNEYMKFLHEAYKCDTINIDNEYAGTWSFIV